MVAQNPQLASGRRSCSSSMPAQSLRSLWLGWAVMVIALLPVLIAIWTVAGMTTQDGPTHLYNSWILNRSFAPYSPYHGYFSVHWQPLPNWAGHLALALLVELVSPWSADRIMITLTLLGFSASFVWLRWRVRGAEGIVGGSVLAALLGLNFPWLLGFNSFLLGCCLLAITLGVWWVGRDRLEPLRLVSLAILLVLGYFGHLVSLGLTVAALGFLSLFAPARDEANDRWRSRLVRMRRTALPCLPLILLGAVYLRIARQGGPMHAVWENLKDPHSNMLDPYSIWAWISRMGWVDPLTLARKDMLPFTEQRSRLFFVFSPVGWLVAAGLIVLLGIAIAWWRNARSPRTVTRDGSDRPGGFSVVACRRTRQAWLGLGLFLLLAGWLGPDSLGSSHGEYLPQRLEILGLAALVPAIDFKLGTRHGRLALGCLVVAGILQTLIVWDYAQYCDRTAGQIMRASDLVGRNQRIATVLIRISSRFRCNPLLHADSWLGVGTGNILWSNYEVRCYYFPVQFRPGVDHPNSRRFEDLALKTDPRPTETAIAVWEEILTRHHGSIDRVVAWHRDPALDAITDRWFEVTGEAGDVRIFSPRATLLAKHDRH
ncbi:MAG: hypothetical protein ACP5XB_22615 [Isosphaeraceae bacterium]